MNNPLRELYPPACRICPRGCGAARTEGPTGYCRLDDGLRIAAICRHRGEEPPISGSRGAVNVFFAHCNLQCLFCQNYQISRNDSPAAANFLSPEKAIAEIEKHLDEGVGTVGYVSPSHCLPWMTEIVRELKGSGRPAAHVMNTNAYDRVEAVRELEEVIDVYLPDFKYNLPAPARDYSGAGDYPETARAAIAEMFRQKGEKLIVGKDGYARSGLIIRHLVLPGEVENSLSCLRWIADNLSPEVHLSLMAQYHPNPAATSRGRLGGFLREDEYELVVEEMERLGFVNGWTQDPLSRDSYLPDFDRAEVFTD